MAKICSSWKYQVAFEETIGMLLIVKYPVGSKQVGSIHFSKPEARIREDTKSWKARKAEKLSGLWRVMERVSVHAVGYTRHPDEDMQTMLQLSSLLPAQPMRLKRNSYMRGKIEFLPHITLGEGELTEPR